MPFQCYFWTFVTSVVVVNEQCCIGQWTIVHRLHVTVPEVTMNLRICLRRHHCSHFLPPLVFVNADSLYQLIMLILCPLSEFIVRFCRDPLNKGGIRVFSEPQNCRPPSNDLTECLASNILLYLLPVGAVQLNTLHKLLFFSLCPSWNFPWLAKLQNFLLLLRVFVFAY